MKRRERREKGTGKEYEKRSRNNKKERRKKKQK